VELCWQDLATERKKGKKGGGEKREKQTPVGVTPGLSPFLLKKKKGPPPRTSLPHQQVLMEKGREKGKKTKQEKAV